LAGKGVSLTSLLGVPHVGSERAALGRFFVDEGHFRLSATSDGWSMLVLPMEYSRCLHLDKKAESAGARLFRVDLLMTGVLFTKKLDARLTYHTGPFTDSLLSDLRCSGYENHEYPGCVQV
jgi:hypothetical protein